MQAFRIAAATSLLFTAPAGAFQKCEGATRACYAANLAVTTQAARTLLGLAHEAERALDAGVALRKGFAGDLRSARAAFNRVHPSSWLDESGFWGFRYKSGAEMELHHYALERCEHAAVGLRDAAGGSPDIDEAVHAILDIEHCEAALKTSRKGGAFRARASRELAECTASPGADVCRVLNADRDAMQARREAGDAGARAP